MIWYFVRMFQDYIFHTLESWFRSHNTRRIRHNSDSDEELSSIDHSSVPLLQPEELIPDGPIEKTWVDNLPFEIPFGFATTFKSDEDWLDEWEELENKPRTRKPYTFDDRVDDYRRGIKKALLITEKKEEKEEEVDLLFAEDEEEDSFLKEEGRENFTPMCTPTRNRKNLLACDEGEWDSDWDEQDNDDHPNIRKEQEMMYV